MEKAKLIELGKGIGIGLILILLSFTSFLSNYQVDLPLLGEITFDAKDIIIAFIGFGFIFYTLKSFKTS